jgi:hypothetical protein
MIREMPQWGNDIARSQMKQLGDRLIMGAKFMSKQGDNSGGSESREISQEEFENDDFGAVGEEGEYDSLAASGMEGTDPFNKDPLAPGNTELSAEDIGDDFERDSYDMNQDDPQDQYAGDHNQRIAEQLMQAQQGPGVGPEQMQQVQAQYNPEQQPTNSPYFGTGQAPQMDPAVMEQMRMAQMRNSGMPQAGIPQGRFQIPQTPYQGRRY